MKIAILGGTFNPIHQGHLLIAENAVKSLNLDKVFFAPCSIPPHKTEHQLLPDHHRVAMVKLGISGKPKFDILTFEIDRKGTSYTVDTVSHLSSQYPNDQIFLFWDPIVFKKLDIGVPLQNLRLFAIFLQSSAPAIHSSYLHLLCLKANFLYCVTLCVTSLLSRFLLLK